MWCELNIALLVQRFENRHCMFQGISGQIRRKQISGRAQKKSKHIKKKIFYG